MKSLKSKLLLLSMAICMSFTFAQDNDNFQAYSVHEDQVKPSKALLYEQTSKALADKMREHNVQSTSWLTVSLDNFNYMFVTPIEKMADLDENPMAELAEKMGDEAFSDLFSNFNKCYDRHGTYVIVMDKALTYMPDGIDQAPEGQNYRKFYYIYYRPEDGAAMREAMKGVKELFASKKSTNYYRVYRSGFGQLDSYYMVAVASKDPIEMAQNAEANDKLLGADAQPAFSKVLALALRMEEMTGNIRPDLGYQPKKE